MADFDIWGNPAKKKKKEQNIFGGSIDLGFKPKRKQQSPLNIGFGLPQQNKEVERDTRRSFSQSQRNDIWDKQNGKCARCKNPLKRASTHYDHITPWERGGRTEVKNGQALCANCHSEKTNKDRLKKVDKKRKSRNTNPSFSNNPFLAPARSLFG